ncbi:hypothetical protein J6590_101187 [Homalodisca vitripennis]|nr:hypothetical protein J6590_101187 [Homalodisca vitripennis]
MLDKRYTLLDRSRCRRHRHPSPVPQYRISNSCSGEQREESRQRFTRVLEPPYKHSRTVLQRNVWKLGSTSFVFLNPSTNHKAYGCTIDVTRVL